MTRPWWRGTVSCLEVAYPAMSGEVAGSGMLDCVGCVSDDVDLLDGEEALVDRFVELGQERPDAVFGVDDDDRSGQVLVQVRDAPGA